MDAIKLIGKVYKNYTFSNKCQEKKVSLGLPRSISKTKELLMNVSELPHGVAGDGKRHASPIRIHIVKTKNNKYSARITAFPSKHLRDINGCVSVLKQIINEFKKQL